MTGYLEASVDGRQYAIPAVEVETGSVQVLNVRQDRSSMVSMHRNSGRRRKYCQSICGENRQEKIPFRWLVRIKYKMLYQFLDTGTTTGGFDAVFTANGAYPTVLDDDGNVTYGTDSE